jgi:hypothetical protein
VLVHEENCLTTGKKDCQQMQLPMQEFTPEAETRDFLFSEATRISFAASTRVSPAVGQEFHLQQL